MAWFYVRTHADGTGTGTGDQGRYATQQTGDWDTTFTTTAEYYPSIEAALAATTPPVAGDFIMCSDIHDVTDAANLVYGLSTDQYIMTYSVDDTDIAVYKAGAIERTASPNDVAFESSGYRQHFHGVDLYIEDDFRMSSPNTAAELVDSTITFTGSADQFNLAGGDAAALTLINPTVNWALGTTTACILMANDAYVRVLGGGFNATTNTLNDLIGGASAANGGINAEFIGTDLTDITGYLLADTGATKGSDDNILVRIDKCPLSGSLTGFVEEAFVSPGQEVLVTHSASSSAAAEYQYFYKSWVGTAEDQNSSGIVRADSTPFTESSEVVSIQAITTANASIGCPFRFRIPARYAALTKPPPASPPTSNSSNFPAIIVISSSVRLLIRATASTLETLCFWSSSMTSCLSRRSRIRCRSSWT